MRRFNSVLSAAAPIATHSSRRLVPVLLLLACLGPDAAAVDVLSSRYNDARTGANLGETLLNVQNVNPQDFGLLFKFDTKAAVYAQPLFVSDVDIPKVGRRNVLFVVTVNNDVLAFDADGPLSDTDSAIIWSRSLGLPQNIEDVVGDAGNGNVLPNSNLGIMGTPVIDRERGILFVVARTKRTAELSIKAPKQEPPYSQRLHALDIRTGQDLSGSPVRIEAQRGDFVFSPRIQNQRAGLALANGNIIIAWAGHQDSKLFVGWVMSYRYDGGKFDQTGTFVTTAAGKADAARFLNTYICIDVFNPCALGGIWQSGRAPAVDSQGRVLLLVGNGHNNTRDANRKASSYGNTFLVLDPRSLTVVDFFTPDHVEWLNTYDLDFGGSGPMIIPQSTFESVLGGGKEGRMYVWNLRSLPGAPPPPYSLGARPAQEFFAGNWRQFPALPEDLREQIKGFLNATDQGLLGPTIADWLSSLVDSTIPRAGHLMGGPVKS